MKRLLAALAITAAAVVSGAAVRVTADVREVELGRRFALTVERTFPEGAEPEWSDTALAPLRVRLVDATRREAGGQVVETRTYDAWAFVRGEVVEPPILVRAALDPAAPGPAELPGGLLSRRSSWPLIAGLGLGACAAVALLLVLRRRRRVAAPEPGPAEPIAPPSPGPGERALRRIERLSAIEPTGRAETQRWYVEASGVARDYAGERFGPPAARMTTEECLAALGPDGAGVGDFLRHCDSVKYAARRPEAAARRRMLDGLAAWVRETSA